MKLKFSIGLWMLLGLAFAIGAVGLVGCSDDDDLNGDVYHGYIEDVETLPKYFVIKITHSPYNVGELNKQGEPMPLNNDILHVTSLDRNHSDFDNFKKSSNLSFRILPPPKLEFFSPNEDTHASIEDSHIWENCAIEIIELY